MLKNQYTGYKKFLTKIQSMSRLAEYTQMTPKAYNF